MAKIIICEDDPMISEIYKKKFQEAGLEVILADTGEQVLSTAKKDKIDVILLDLIMPKMSGFEIIEKLRNGQYDEKIKIIIFSNLSQPQDREKGIRLGADGFIVKSDFSPSALVREVMRIIQQSNEEKINEQRIGNGLENQAKDQQDGDKKQILLIEDEEVFVEMFGEKLEQDGFRVTSARNGAEGMAAALNGKYDLIITDLVMPAMGGDEIIPRLKMEDATKNIPIIVLSASINENDSKKIAELGVDYFFVKTQIIPSELSKKVQEILK